MRLDGTVAWVIGASSGIGAATARELVCRGAAVAVSARRAQNLKEVAAGNMFVAPIDVTDTASVAAAAARVRNALGPIDLVVYSAGYWKQMDATDWDTDDFNRHLGVNLTGLSNTLAAVLPAMLERGDGVIAAVSSVAGYRGLAGAGAYGATKAAQRNLLESLRVELAPLGIRVTTISPGFVRTDLTAQNRFPMPFIIDASEAANEICDGLQRNRTEIVFPLPMALLAKFAIFVPSRVWTALWRQRPERNQVQIRRTVTVEKPIETVFAYLSDFTTTTEWDPGTVQTVREHGSGGVGTVYLNTSRFLGRATQLRYVVQEFDPPRRIALRGENATVTANDTITCSVVPGGTRVTYVADFIFTGLARYAAPLFRPAIRRLGSKAEGGLRTALARLPEH